MRWGPFWFEVFFFIFCILFKSLTQIYHNGWRSFFESSYFVSTFEYLGNISGELKSLVPGSKKANWMAPNSVLTLTRNNLYKKLAATSEQANLLDHSDREVTDAGMLCESPDSLLFVSPGLRS